MKYCKNFKKKPLLHWLGSAKYSIKIIQLIIYKKSLFSINAVPYLILFIITVQTWLKITYGFSAHLKLKFQEVG